MSDGSSRGPLRRLLNRLEVDRAVFYAISLRAWQLAAGPISVLVIAAYFSPETQGYYYTFAALMALQTFFELGLNIVIINVSSHEWLRLELNDRGAVVGDPAARSRLVSLGRLLTSWYAVAAVLFFLGVGVAGAVFLGQKVDAGVVWQAPWGFAVLLSACLLALVPFVSVLEGCGQIAVVNRYRFCQTVTANLAVWVCICLEGGLWACVASVAARVLWDLFLVFVRYRGFFRVFTRPPEGPHMAWKLDVWPMQWRLAVSGVFSYFAFSLFTPVMFHYHGAAVAGQMGMTWTLAFMLQAVALAWVQTRAPLFGQLVAKQDFRELDRVFTRVSVISSAVVVTGALALWLVVWGVNYTGFGLASRLLEPLPTGLLLLAVVVYHLPNAQAFYLRAHKREPLLVASVVCNALIGLCVWWFGKRYGPLGAVSGYLVVAACLVFPWHSAIWWQCRITHET